MRENEGRLPRLACSVVGSFAGDLFGFAGFEASRAHGHFILYGEHDVNLSSGEVSFNKKRLSSCLHDPAKN